MIGDAGAEALAVADDVLAGEFAADILAQRDIFHLGRDDAATGIVHLADIMAGTRAQDAFGDVGERGDAARAIGTELAVVFGTGGARGDLLDIAAGHDPVAAQLGQAALDIDADGRVGVGAAGVVNAQRRFARAGFEVDLSHRDAVGAEMDLAAAADRAGGDADRRGVLFNAGIDVGHKCAPISRSGERSAGVRSVPSLRRY